MEPASQDGPKISDLEIVGPRVAAGCPITLRLRLRPFRGEDRQGRWSNVLSGRTAVDAAPDGAQCS